MKRLPVFILVAALILALVAGGSAVLPRFVSAQGNDTPTPPALPNERPVISATLPDSSTVEGVLEESCWPQTTPDQQLCQFASDSTPTTTITIANDQAITLSVAPDAPAPNEFLALVYLDPPPANGEAAATVDLTSEQGTLKASALPAGNSNFLVAVIASYAVADGGEYYVRSNFKVTVSGGVSAPAKSEATASATLEATGVVSASTTEAPSGSATPEAVIGSSTPTAEVVVTEAASATSEMATAEATVEGLITATPMSAADEATALAQTRNAVVTAVPTSAGTTASGTSAVSPTVVPPTETLTPTNTDTATFTPTPTFTATFTPTFTFTPTPTNTPTFTFTPTNTFTPTPTATNTPLAPDLIIRVGGRDFAPIRLTVSFTGSEGDAVTVSRANRAGSFRVLASPADAAQIIFTGPRPAALRVTLLSSDGLTELNSQALSPDNLVLYTLPSEPGAYVVAIEVQFSQLGTVKATYFFRLVVNS